MRAAFTTLGCKVNQYETGVLWQQFAAAGFDIVEPDADAEVYVVNSCTVTAAGDKKSRQMLRRFRRQNPAAVICLTGCFPQAFPDAAEKIPEADVITGSKNRAGLLLAVQRRMAGGPRVCEITPHRPGDAFESMRQVEADSRTRAFVKIQDGCDRYCAYCIIPTARGPVRSKPLADLRAELETLAATRYREVVLAGINLSRYGQDLGLRLLDALEVACAAGFDRVRLGSLEPELLTPGDIEAMARLPGLCPQFHLSLQSGCDATLARMRRHYDTAEYTRIAENLRAAFPGCALTTDVMAGFPGETEEEFRQSLDFVRRTGFAKVHVFAYSPRPGTRAAELPGQIPQAEKTRRAGALSACAAETRAAFLAAQVGTVAPVMIEWPTRPGHWEGYTPNYTPVHLEGEGDLARTLQRVWITGVGEDWCTGELVQITAEAPIA